LSQTVPLALSSFSINTVQTGTFIAHATQQKETPIHETLFSIAAYASQSTRYNRISESTCHWTRQPLPAIHAEQASFLATTLQIKQTKSFFLAKLFIPHHASIDPTVNSHLLKWVELLLPTCMQQEN
jgi:hypothetical protein